MAIAKKNPAVTLVDFGDDSPIYSQSFDLPEGDYCMTDVSTMLFAGFNADKQGDPRLGVMLTLVNLKAPDEEPRQVFYSMGSKAHLSFSPSPDGKGLVAVPGGSGTIPSSTNWVMLRDSLKNSGLPKGILKNDFSTIEGIHVHMQSVPEPKERASFKSNTGDAQPEEQRFTRNVAIVTEILDDGKPWEGTGGLPEAGAKKKAAPTLVKKGVKKVEPEPEPEVEEAETDEDGEAVKTAAEGALATALEGKDKGVAKAALKLAVSKYVAEMFDDETKEAVLATYFSDDKALGAILADLGYEIKGPMVKPVA